MAPKGPDEGAMIEFLRLTMGASLRRQGRVSPCGASFFPSDGKETKGSPGDAAGAHSVRLRATEVVGPYGQIGRFPYFVGAAHRAARERPDEGIGPYEKHATTPVSAVSLRTT